ncbi:MAG: YkgJ family cysteine cluster protein [bacterium]|nr:YkgJ family cysteine cluster protein [bacterium]
MVTAHEDDQFRNAIESEFECTRCGQCCKGDGVVRINLDQAQRMAAALGMDKRRFLKAHAIRAGLREWWLKDKLQYPGGLTGPEEKWCIFLEVGEDRRYFCRVNDVKPQQCRDFPAKWQNGDSLFTCMGLRRLRKKLAG